MLLLFFISSVVLYFVISIIILNKIMNCNKALYSDLHNIIENNKNDLYKNLCSHIHEMSELNKQHFITMLTNSKLDVINSINIFLKQNNDLLKILNNSLNNDLQSFSSIFTKEMDNLNIEQKKHTTLISNSLDKILHLVTDKLHFTLHSQLGESFNIVNKHLKYVQNGLLEMKNIAQDVGGLKKILTNIKISGSFSELQLSMLLAQILSPTQYQANVKTKNNSTFSVEFAVKLPGIDNGSICWIPIDAKFPKILYQNLQDAYESGIDKNIQSAQKKLDTSIRKMARDINIKYIDPPNTTDFGILFLPFEGLYFEVVRKSYLLEEIQRDYKVIIAGPTTLAVILNSLQVGFKTLAIQKRSSEVWNVLVSVKEEFKKFSLLLQHIQKNVYTVSSQLDEVMGVRTRSIEKKLHNIQIINKNL
jgi:DNA recombination protein RmuC